MRLRGTSGSGDSMLVGFSSGDQGPRGYATRWVLVDDGPPQLWQQYVVEKNQYIGSPTQLQKDVVDDYDPRLDDNRAPVDGSVTVQKLDPSLQAKVTPLTSPYFSTSTVGLLNSNTDVDGSTKQTAVGVPNHDNTKHAFYGVVLFSDTSLGNRLRLGGGEKTGYGTAAEHVEIYTTPDGSTGGGVFRGYWHSDGTLYQFKDLTLGDGTTAEQRTLAVNAPAGQFRTVQFQSAGVARFNIRVDNAAESGGDAGSNLQVQSRADDGSGKTTLVNINRQTGVCTLGGQLVTPAATTSYASVNIPHGSAPTGPANGDVWTTTVAMFCRVNGTTRQMATLDGTETFSNKTFASPRIGTGMTYPTGTVLSLFNTSDETTNYERARHFWNSNAYTIAAENGGTGTGRTIVLSANSKTLTIGDNSSTKSWFDLAAGTSVSQPVVRITGTMSQSSGVMTGISIAPTISQSGTAGYVGLLVNPTESATGSGSKILADLQVGGVSKFKVDNTGTQTLADAANIAVGSTTGAKIATATTQKLGFWNAAPVVQPTAVVDATNATDVITQLNALLARMRTIGLIAP